MRRDTAIGFRRIQNTLMGLLLGVPALGLVYLLFTSAHTRFVIGTILCVVALVWAVSHLVDAFHTFDRRLVMYELYGDESEFAFLKRNHPILYRLFSLFGYTRTPQKNKNEEVSDDTGEGSELG